MSEERTNMAIRDLKHYVIDNMSLDVQDDFEIICKYITNLQQKVERLEKENLNIRENIHLERISLPPELTKDKNFMELYDIPSYEDLKNKIEQLKKENNDLRRIYQNTYKKYLENGNEEMAHYFMAQIDACPTFYVEPVIDYYKEYHKVENIRKEAIESLEEQLLRYLNESNYKLNIFDLRKTIDILNKGSDINE